MTLMASCGSMKQRGIAAPWQLVGRRLRGLYGWRWTAKRRGRCRVGDRRQPPSKPNSGDELEVAGGGPLDELPPPPPTAAALAAGSDDGGAPPGEPPPSKPNSCSAGLRRDDVRRGFHGCVAARVPTGRAAALASGGAVRGAPVAGCLPARFAWAAVRSCFAPPPPGATRAWSTPTTPPVAIAAADAATAAILPVDVASAAACSFTAEPAIRSCTPPAIAS